MKRRITFEEAFADEIWDEEQERQQYAVEQQLANHKGRLQMAPQTLPGYQIGIGGVIHTILDAEKMP